MLFEIPIERGDGKNILWDTEEFELDLRLADEGKTAEAALAVKRLIEWFFANFSNPDECVPFSSGLGDYLWEDSGPYTADDALQAADFRHELVTVFGADGADEIHRVAVSQLESLGVDEWASQQALPMLLMADPHKFGPGRTHLFEYAHAPPLNGKTACGLTRERCPGTIYHGVYGEIDCKRCLRAIETARRREEEDRIGPPPIARCPECGAPIFLDDVRRGSSE
jgi:hypothetical protein